MLSFSFRISSSWIGKVIKEVILAIKRHMFYALPHPTKDDFSSNAIEFGKKWNFPNVMGCLDGKHIRIRCPSKTGSLYYNYKDFFSIVLFALVGPTYKFIAIDVGSYGREGDAGIFSKCALGRAIQNKVFDSPQATMLPGSDVVAPYVFLGDEAFPLLENLVKPYPRNQSSINRHKSIFNYRLSRARRIVENAFGIVSQIFRIFFTPIHLKISVVEDLVTVACILHNLMIDEKGSLADVCLESDPNELVPLSEHNEDEGDSGEELKYQIRDKFKDYFNSVGAVSWQHDSFRL
ncbi:uncharacterized protein LOC116349641 isoform X2 [Contarinia nasturtii]|uniref:uncharacterized protein LOC116349641 isoform X2 n=1 Tax=Contarinia nasturtii TaxID=265458 RepID=UPI0012D3E0FB|nr:uncharacterized protein LOC116349641 isoform X2 [Contarinia nasturtii]